MKNRLLTAVVPLAVMFGVGAATLPAAEPPAVDYNRDIRPILAEHCFLCHGPDGEHREAGLRLDLRETALAELDSGETAIVPGVADQSALLERVASDDDDVRMPPADTGKRLSPEEIEKLRRWIASGAEWNTHWAFVSPARPALPAVKDSAWPRGAIDHFILSRLDSETITPSPEADKTTLIRRVTFDLTGLPPTLEEIDAFLADDSPEAYERVVDRLLDSPHYGEHRARFWLDAARYGDTHGLHLDNYRSIWPYRDWVIAAFNRNLPFDQFTVEQLAGDLLPDATREQRIATGFNRCNVTTSEGGSIDEEYYVRYTVDRVETTSTVWMGLTTGCAVCHDHKYDPITQREFYGLFAFFNNLTEKAMDGNQPDPQPVIKVPTPEQTAELARLDEAIAANDARLNELAAEVESADEAWRAAWRERLANDWQVLAAESAVSIGGASIETLDDHTIVVSGENPDKDLYELLVRTDAIGVQAVRLEVLTDDSLPGRGPGRAENGNLVLTEFEVEAVSVVDPNQSRPVTFTKAAADFSQSDDFKIGKAVDGVVDEANGWAVAGHERHADGLAMFFPDEPFGYEGGTVLRIRLRQTSQHKQHTLGKFRLALSTKFTPTEDEPIDEFLPVVPLLAKAADERSDDDKTKLAEYYRRHHAPQWMEASQGRARLAKEREQLDGEIPTTLVMRERDEPREAFMLIRGEYDKKGDAVERGVPAVLPGLASDAPRDRLGLARWLIDPSHPLTARVTVNRFWQQIFGAGLVKTSEDFGTRGELPSHPELLDWLAVEFIESGWNVKALQRLMVTSAAYRQSSRVTPELHERDPANRLLARGPRFRLDAEMIRDNALAVSGSLVRRIGGPSVKPYQPGGLWEAVGYTSSNTAKFKQDHGDALYRRGLYTFWKRTSPPPTMTTFDAPSRESCTVARARTNTPLQALLLMNDTQYVEAARRLAERVMREAGPEPRERARHAFRLATARPPSDEELTTLLGAFQRQLDIFTHDAEAAEKFLSVGDSERDPALDVNELAAWAMIANLILNLDETVTKG